MFTPDGALSPGDAARAQGQLDAEEAVTRATAQAMASLARLNARTAHLLAQAGRADKAADLTRSLAALATVATAIEQVRAAWQAGQSHPQMVVVARRGKVTAGNGKPHVHRELGGVFVPLSVAGPLLDAVRRLEMDYPDAETTEAGR